MLPRSEALQQARKRDACPESVNRKGLSSVHEQHAAALTHVMLGLVLSVQADAASRADPSSNMNPKPSTKNAKRMACLPRGYPLSRS